MGYQNGGHTDKHYKEVADRLEEAIDSPATIAIIHGIREELMKATMYIGRKDGSMLFGTLGEDCKYKWIKPMYTPLIKRMMAGFAANPNKFNDG